MVRSKVRSRSSKPRPTSEVPRPRRKSRRAKLPQEYAPRRPDIYSWVLVALMLFAGTTSATIAYNYGQRALDVVREVPAGGRSLRPRRVPTVKPDRPTPQSTPQSTEQPTADTSPN